MPTATIPASIPRAQLSDVQVARFTDRPGDWMVTEFGSLWVKRDDGSVDRVDEDGSVRAHVDVRLFQSPVCQGIGVTAKAVWVCPRGGLLDRIDPRTSKVVATIKIPKVNEQGRLPGFDGRIWVLTGDGDRLIGVSERTDEQGSAIALPEYCNDVSDRVVDGVLWVACTSDGVLLRVDLTSGKVTGHVDGLPLVSNVGIGDHLVWAGFEKGLAQIDPTSLRVVRVHDVAAAPYGSLRVTTSGVWAREGGNTDVFMVGFSDSGKIRHVISAADALPSGGDVIEFGGALWTTSYEENVLRRLPLDP